MFLDDGMGAASSLEECFSVSSAIRKDITSAGFVISEKSRFGPTQVGPSLVSYGI